MSLEIEKKYLIKDPSKDLIDRIENAKSKEITQHYLKVEENIEQRIRRIRSKEGIFYYLTTKTKIDENKREETEIIIDRTVYEFLKKLSIGRIQKERYTFPLTESLYAEVDFFYDGIDLNILEIEFKSEKEFNSFDSSLISIFDNDTIKDVTTNNKFKNAYIALNKNEFY